MALTARTQELLEKVLAVLPAAEEELITKGITGSITDRVLELKRAAHRLEETYGTVEKLEKRIKKEGISPDDHTLYNDLLECGQLWTSWINCWRSWSPSDASLPLVVSEGSNQARDIRYLC